MCDRGPATRGHIMGYTTDFIGYVGIEPALNEAEVEYLTAFTMSRRFDREGGPYAVPGNPRAEEDDRSGIPVERYNSVAPGQPQLWCQWIPSWSGHCLTFDGHEKFYRPVEWLDYLIEHFLKRGAHASKHPGHLFAGFTFDHVLNGTIAGSRRDTHELFLIDVVSNHVSVDMVRSADPQYVGLGVLPYEKELDHWAAERVRRRSDQV